jgi:PAS domain S-box-containing protein
LTDSYPKTFLEKAYERITQEEQERSFLFTDARLDDNPIILVNSAFIRLTGYSREEVLGRNCRFLQGKDTNPDTVQALHEAIEQGEAITADILNYKKDGTPFWNRLRIRPIFSESGEIESFVGVQNPIDPSEVRIEPLHGIQD